MVARTFAWLGLALILSSTSFAGEAATADPARRGWYAGAGATYAVEDFSTAAGVTADDAAGVRLVGGYRAHPRFAAELAVDWLHGFDVRTAYGSGRIDAVTTTLDGKGYLATRRVQPYGVADVGGLYVAGFDSSLRNVLGLAGGLVGRVGGGVDVYAAPHLVMSAEATYDVPAGSVSSLRFVPLTLAAHYRF